MGSMDLSALRKAVTLHDDAETREAAGVDFGRITRKTPRAVATPASSAEAVRVIQYARRARLPISIQGAAHSQSGHSLTGDGILLNTGSLNRIGEIEGDVIRVEAGVRWRDLVRYVHARGYMPTVLTSKLDVTIGGTLSIAGLGPASHLYGSQADNVAELETVTGEGRPVRCSPTENQALFDCTRCGLGQFSVITAARIRLREARPRVRTFGLLYDDLATLMQDQERVISQGRFQYLESHCRSRDQELKLRRPDAPLPPHAPWLYHLDLTAEFDREPDERGLLADLNYRQRTYTRDQTVLDYVEGIVTAEALSPAPWPPGAVWNLAHPWTCGVLPWDTAAACISAALEDLPADLLARSHIMLAPAPGSVFQAPIFMRPGGEYVMGFGIFPAVPPGALPRVLPIMEKFGNTFTDTGGKRYLSGWVNYSHEQWQAHYGDLWPQFLEWKASFDPDGVFSPGIVRYEPDHCQGLLLN